MEGIQNGVNHDNDNAPACSPLNQDKHEVSDNCNEQHDQSSQEQNQAVKENAVNEKTNKAKPRKNRELGKLEENKIIQSRLRSESGKVYTSSVTVDMATNSNPSSPTLGALEEEIDAEMCPQDCCKKSDTIISMISRLQTSIDDLTGKFTKQERIQAVTTANVQDIQEKTDKNEEAIDELRCELKETRFQLKVATNLLAKQDEQIGFLSKKITQIQQREMEGNVVISGIPETQRERPMALFNDFVLNQLEIQELIPVHKAFRLGTGDSRPLLVQLRDPDQKRKLFAHATKLKGKKNSKGGFFFISEHLPEELNESRRRANELFSENKKKQSSHQLDMEFKKGQLVINQELYTKAVKVPSIKDIANPSDELYDKAVMMDIAKGDEDRKGGSLFVSFAAAVTSIEEINSAYLKLKMKYADATHISCAFRLPGANTPQNQDYVDDGEFGSGRIMLKVLKNAQLMNVAVFVMRQYGGKHIGPVRFRIIQRLTEVALQEMMKKRQQEGQQSPQPIPSQLQNPPFPLEEWSEIREDWSTTSDKKTD